MSNLKLVLWSGGCDSTLALYEALEQQKCWTKVVAGKPELVSEVRAIAVVEPCVPCNANQGLARAKLLTAFAERKLPVRFVEVSLSHMGDQPSRGKDGGSIQTQLWLGAVAPYMHDDEDLVIGWIEGEMYLTDVAERAFDALQRLNGKAGKLVFPLHKRPKVEVLAKLRRLELLHLCWFCEGDVVDAVVADMPAPCGRCKKCLVHATALWQLERFGESMLYRSGMLEQEPPDYRPEVGIDERPAFA